MSTYRERERADICNDARGNPWWIRSESACIQISHLFPQMGSAVPSKRRRNISEQSRRCVRGKARLLCSPRPSCSIEIRAAHASPLLWSLTLLFLGARRRWIRLRGTARARHCISIFFCQAPLHQLKIGWNGPKGQHG
jgi:hypothetical protein